MLEHGVAAVWERWRRKVRPEDLDPPSRDLLPLLWRNLRRHGIEHPSLRLYAGVYRSFWYRNQILLAEAAETLTLLESHGVGTLLLGDAPLALAHYRDAGLRRIGDLAVRVPAGRAGSVATLLTHEAGWQLEGTRNGTAGDRLPLRLRNERGFRLRLETDRLSDLSRTRVVADPSPGTEPLKLQGAATHCLKAADQLLSVLAPTPEWRRSPPLQWAADASTLLRGSAETLDWDGLAATAHHAGLTLPVYLRLSYLRTALDAPVPHDCLDSLGRAPVSRRAARELSVRMGSHTLPRRLQRRWYEYRRSAEASGSRLSAPGFIRHLQERWGVDGFTQTFRFLASTLSKRLTRSS
jgi:hypothetical protein